MDYVVIILLLPFTISNVSSKCCHRQPYCHDCFQPGKWECCGKNPCNIFCCNCDCRQENPCELPCTLRNSPKRKKRETTFFKTVNSSIYQDLSSVNALMSLIDTTRDGRIDLTEMITWFTNNFSINYVRKSFKQLDINKDEFLTSDEIDPPLVIKNRGKRSLNPSNCSYESLIISKDDEIKLKMFALSENALSGPPKSGSENLKGSHSVHVTTRTASGGKMCGYKIVIKSADNEVIYFKKPDFCTYKCGYQVIRKIKTRILESSKKKTEVINFDADKIKILGFIALGYTDLILHSLCFKFITFGLVQIPEICFDSVFFKNCVSLEVYYFESIIDGEHIKFSGSPRSGLGIVINNFAYFVRKYGLYKENNPDQIRVIKKLCRLIQVINLSQCGDKTKGCPIEEDSFYYSSGSLVDPNGCDLVK